MAAFRSVGNNGPRSMHARARPFLPPPPPHTHTHIPPPLPPPPSLNPPAFKRAPHTLQRINRKTCGRAGRGTFCSPTASSAAARSACFFFGALCPRAHVPREHRAALHADEPRHAAYTAPCPSHAARCMLASAVCRLSPVAMLSTVSGCMLRVACCVRAGLRLQFGLRCTASVATLSFASGLLFVATCNVARCLLSVATLSFASGPVATLPPATLPIACCPLQRCTVVRPRRL